MTKNKNIKTVKNENNSGHGVKKKTIGDIVIYIILGLITLISFLPFWHILACTFASASDVRESAFLLFPKHFTLSTIKYVFASKSIT